MLVPIVAIALGLHDVRFAPLQGAWWRIAGIAVGTFFGMLWVVALGEELFFRGVDRAWAAEQLAFPSGRGTRFCTDLRQRPSLVPSISGLAPRSGRDSPGNCLRPCLPEER